MTRRLGAEGAQVYGPDAQQIAYRPSASSLVPLVPSFLPTDYGMVLDTLHSSGVKYTKGRILCLLSILLHCHRE